MDAAFQALGQYDWRVGTIYPNPAHLVDAPKPEQAGVYHVWPIAMRTTKQVSYFAPTFGFKTNMQYPTANPLPANYGAVATQAPTAGIYTGIPSGCSAGGHYGGNPYS